MKILFYIATMEHEGGAERVMSVIANELNNQGDNIIMVNDFPISEREYDLSDKIERYYLAPNNEEGYLIKNFKRIIRLRKLIKGKKPDIVVSFLYMQNIRLLFSCLGIDVKTIISVRNDPEREFGEKGIKKWLINAVYGLADGIVFQTMAEREFFSYKNQKKSRIILNPIDNKFFRISPTTSSHNIVTFGRLTRQKNHKLLIDAFNEIHKKYPKEKLFIYGEGELRNELEGLISSLGLEDSVLLPGRIDNVEEKMQDAKIFVLSSDYEGLPNALMEAMAVGIPVISTDCAGGGPRTIIKDGQNGILTECGNSDELTAAMLKYIENPSFSEYVAKNAKRQATEFTTDRVICKWREYMIKVLRDN